MTVINTNTKSLVSQNAITKNNRDLSDAMQQLSTGKRINSAKDDAAGLAISSRMTSQITGLDQAVRNGNDAVSLLQTTEGAMVEMSNMLQRMRELAIQSANDTYTSDDRNYIDLEFQQLKQEVNRITRDTQWNGMDVMSGEFVGDSEVAGTFRFQVGGSQGQVITHTVAAMGFKASTGEIDDVVATPYDGTTTPATAQVSDLTLSGEFTAGDQISVTINDVTATYTITGNDLISGTSASMLEAITSQLSTKFGAAFAGIGVSNNGAVLSLTANPAAAFSPTVAITYVNDDGALTNIKDLDVTNSTNSNTAIAELDVAINRINTERAGMGAVMNRLIHAVDNMVNVSQNTSESRSRILDADYAKASSELARTQIISQAATAMLAQANQSNQSVLQLLQG
jgi:flagellin